MTTEDEIVWLNTESIEIMRDRRNLFICLKLGVPLTRGILSWCPDTEYFFCCTFTILHTSCHFRVH